MRETLRIALLLAGIGASVGLVYVFAIEAVLEGLLYATRTTDVWMLVGLSTAFMAVAGGAAWLVARKRAGRAQALDEE